MHDELKNRWQKLWEMVQIAGNAESIFQDLIQRYQESHRAYHALNHILASLKEFDAVSNFAQNPKAVELAIWYHDAIYDTKAKDNEEKSADLAANTLRQINLPENLIQEIRQLILATKHAAVPEDPDAQLLTDIDLAIFGQAPEKFDEYERQIREEYTWVPEEVFRVKRAEILRAFLDRPAIYFTSHFRKKYEDQAKQNLARSLAKLTNQPAS